MWINNELFKVKYKDIPTVPIEYSEESRAWWAEHKKRCIEGYTVGGKWMPPNLYFYINEGTILLNRTENSKTKVPAKPLLRDIEWEVYTAWAVARGLSGFVGYGSLGDNREDILYKIRNESLSNILTPMYDNEAKDLLLMGPREFGKELSNNELVLTNNGEKKICDIKLNDLVATPFNTYSKVIGVHPQGEKDIYRFSFVDGRTVDAGLEHLWGLYDNKKYKIISTKKLLDNTLSYQHKKSGKSYRYSLPEVQGIEFKEKQYYINPYIIGALLGDGCMTNNSIKIASDDIEIINKFEKLLPNYTLTKDKTNNNYYISYQGEDKFSIEYPHGHNPLIRQITELGLNVHGDFKFIPEEYKYGSIQQRYELVRGLLDTDGSINEDWGSIEFTNKTKQLVDDLAWVLRSLGIQCRIGIDSREGKTITMPQGTDFVMGKYYRLYIKTDKPIFSLKRKLDKIKKRKRSNKVSLINIEKLEQKEQCTCISIEDKRGMFLTTNLIPTHNSYIAGEGIILHEWIFDGAKEYIPGATKERIIVDGEEELDWTVTNIVVGAGDGAYARDLTSKTKLGYDFMAKRGLMFNGKYYPHPFLKKFDGSFSKEVTAKYKKKIGGDWQDYGSNSKIRVASYKDNPYAGQGTRNSVMVKEEIGMFKGLINAQEADLETMMMGTTKFGSCLYIGTGGSMEGGTLDAYRMFYDPATYNLLEFNDTWESKGNISMFISATKRANKFKDDDGITNEEDATAYFLKERERLRNSKNGTQALSAHIQYNPLVPSEIFLRSSGNIFPTTEIKSWLADLETNQIYQDAEMVCDLVFNDSGKVEPRINKDLIPIREFPISGKTNQDTSGAIVIYHHPMVNDSGEIPWGRYLAGIDPYSQEDAGRGKSLGSIIVLDKFSNRIVAEYTGRPNTLDLFYERCRKLLIYYNAQCLYENQILGVKQHFEHKNSLQYLMFQPEYIKDIIPGSKVDRGYGMHMVQQLRDHGLLLIRDWLQDEYEPGKMNLRTIRSIPFLQELVLFDFDTNVDRISAFIMVMYALKEKHKELVEENKVYKVDPFFEKRLFRNR